MNVLVDVQVDHVTVTWLDQTRQVHLAPRSVAPPATPASLRGPDDPLGGPTFLLPNLPGATPASLLRKLASREANPQDLCTAGAWMFTLVGGKGVWDQVMAAARALGAAEPIALQVRAADLHDFVLPWEALHDGDSHLLQRPDLTVTVVREISASGGTAAPIDPPLRVLFVVGVPDHDPVVSAGAELAQLIRRFAEHTALLRLERFGPGSAAELQARVAELRPHIVHIASHGQPAGPGGPAKVRVDVAEATQSWLSAADLAVLLQPPDHTPSIVILNACSTADASFHLSLPLAAGLVQAGLPLAVGMAGPVDDRACRALAIGLYAALIRGEDLPSALSAARRSLATAGLTNAPDWSLPTLFTRSGAAHVVHVDTAVHQTRQALADVLRGLPSPPRGLCDRESIAQRWHHILRQPDRRGLLVTVDRAERGTWGRTALVKELARWAALSGHLPITILGDDLTALPKTPEGLAQLVMDQLHQLSAFVGPAPGILGATLGAADAPATLIQHLDFLLQETKTVLATRLTGPRHAWPNTRDRALLYAIRAELARFGESARQQPAWKASRVVLILDDLHDMGDATAVLRQAILDPSWSTLHNTDPHLRLLLTARTKGHEPELGAQVAEVVKLTESRPAWLDHLVLGPYGDADTPRVLWQILTTEDWQTSKGVQRGVRPRAEGDRRVVTDAILNHLRDNDIELRPGELRKVRREMASLVKAFVHINALAEAE